MIVKILKVSLFLCVTFMMSCSDNIDDSSIQNFKLVYDSPALNWNEALPIGNGRLGGMVYGNVNEERIQTNDDTFWSGEPRNVQNPKAAMYMPKIRELLLNEKNLEAQKLINKTMLGPWNQCYMPLADIILKTDNTDYSDYSRVLDLNRGVVKVMYKKNGITFTREVFSSYPDQAIVMHITADKKESINIKMSLESQVRHNVEIVNDSTLSIKGIAPKLAEPHFQGKKEPIYEKGHGMRFEGRLRILDTDGKLKSDDKTLNLVDASNVTIVYVAATSYNGFDKDPYNEGKDEIKLCNQYVSSLQLKDYKTLLKNHIDDYQKLYNRVVINLGNSVSEKLPLDIRIKNYEPNSDPSLAALYFQFGRYLMISSSRPGSQPVNLQGIWNKDMQPAWSSNWTINCNTEINYWPVESCNLSECHMPLMNMIREATVDGTKTAKNLYNCRGWMAHHNLDIWRTTWPVGGSGSWAIYQVGSAWLCQHIWEHYQFTMDKEFLKEYYPILKGAVLFYMDNLQKDKQGYWVTNPSESFENPYRKPNGEVGWACIGAAQDMQIIRSLFKNTMSAIDILKEDEKFKLQIKQKYDMLAPMKISPTTGRLQEWNDDWQSANPHSGQVAHGWGLVASDLITLRGTPELANAFRKTIDYRKPGYSYNSGSWTGAFPANFWARLGEGDSVQRVIDRHLMKAVSPNLTSKFSNNYWEIDGNLGITSAIAEMLLQSHAGEIDLLPALPSAFPNGYVLGLRARGGYKVDIYWRNGKLEKALISADLALENKKVKIRYNDNIKELVLKKGEIFVYKI